MATTNTMATGTGLFVDTFSGALEDLVPEAAQISSSMPFEEAEKQPGNLYHQAVRLGLEHGAHFDTDGTDFSLSDPGPIAAVYQDAQLKGSAILMPTRVAYVAAQRALKGGKSGYVKSMKPYVEGNALGLGFHQEMSFLYGQVGLANSSAVTASGTSGTFVVDAETWSAALWKTAIGMKADILDSLTGSVQNSNAAVTITGVTESTRTISFSNAAGDAAALDALTTNAKIVRRGAYAGSGTWNECAGLVKILSNTGTLFNISAATHPLWKSINLSAGSASLTYGKVINGLAQAASNGLGKTNVILECSPATVGDLQVDVAALQRFDSSYSSKVANTGSEELRFFGQNGMVTIRPHIYMWEGIALARPEKDFKKIGSTDITYKVPGMPEEQMILQLSLNAGWEFRSFLDCAPFTPRPGSCVYFNAITNSFS